MREPVGIPEHVRAAFAQGTWNGGTGAHTMLWKWLVDAVNFRWVRARQAATGEELLRQLGPSPFSAGRRPRYTRPTNESTLAT